MLVVVIIILLLLVVVTPPPSSSRSPTPAGSSATADPPELVGGTSRVHARCHRGEFARFPPSRLDSLALSLLPRGPSIHHTTISSLHSSVSSFAPPLKKKYKYKYTCTTTPQLSLELRANVRVRVVVDLLPPASFALSPRTALLDPLCAHPLLRWSTTLARFLPPPPLPSPLPTPPPLPRPLDFDVDLLFFLSFFPPLLPPPPSWV